MVDVVGVERVPTIAREHRVPICNVVDSVGAA